MTKRRFLTAFLFSALPLLTLGCGGGDKDEAGRGVVKGKLVENGKPFALDKSKVALPPGATRPPPGTDSGGALKVVFIAADTGEQFPANTQPDAGTFEVTGPDGKGIKAGRYKIAVTASYGFGANMPDYFKGKFTPENTKILRDIKPGEEVVIDIAKPQG